MKKLPKYPSNIKEFSKNSVFNSFVKTAQMQMNLTSLDFENVEKENNL